MFNKVKRFLGVQNNPTYIIVHCSAVSYKISTNQYNSINYYHRDERGFDRSVLGNWIGYHSLITGGKCHKCKEEWEIGNHCNDKLNGLSMNYQSLGICIAFNGDIEMPTKEDTDLLIKQIKVWQAKYNIPNERVKFHRDFRKDKTCPGSLITRQWLDTLLGANIAPTSPQKPPEVPKLTPQELFKQMFRRFFNRDY